MNEWVTSSEAAAILGVHRSTLYRHPIAYRQDGSRSWRRYNRAVLSEYMASHTVRPKRARGLGDPR